MKELCPPPRLPVVPRLGPSEGEAPVFLSASHLTLPLLSDLHGLPPSLLPRPPPPSLLQAPILGLRFQHGQQHNRNLIVFGTEP